MIVRGGRRVLRIARAACAAVLASLPAFAGGGAAGQGVITIHIASAPTLGARAALYADRAGIFRKYGLNVDIQAMASGGAALAAVIGGSVQVDYLNSITLVEAHSRGVAIEIVAPGGYYSTSKPYALLFVKKDSPIQNGRDLNGKTIASGSLKDINAICTLAWIDANGGDSKTVRAVELSNPAIMPALDDGRIAAATLLPPYQAEAIDSGRYRVLGKSYDAVAKSFEFAAWVATKDWALKNPDAVQRFAAAMREAASIANASPAKTTEMVAAFTGVEPAVVERSPSSLDPPYLDPADLQPVIDASVKYGLIPKTFDAAELLDPVVRRPGKP
jgi:NitT/TauT family transport system substrate-binding protein